LFAAYRGLLRQAAEAVTGHAGAAVFQQAARLIIAVCSGPAALLLYLCVCGSVGDLKTLHYRKNAIFIRSLPAGRLHTYKFYLFNKAAYTIKYSYLSDNRS
jgi:hypothetical protein